MLRNICLFGLTSIVVVCVYGVQPAFAAGIDDQVVDAIFVTSLSPWAAEEHLAHAGITSSTKGFSATEAFDFSADREYLRETAIQPGYNQPVIRGQSPGGTGGGGADAAAATDPSAILTQLQFQNVFTPESYGASGYANTFIIQPVLPFPVAVPGLNELFPNHIIRPTLPFPAPTANPDGPLGSSGGMGDLTFLDAFVHPVEGFGNLLLGYNLIAPTSTSRRVGRGEWQLGPAAGVIYKEIPEWILGVLVTTQYSFESDAQQINAFPIIVRHLPNEWYVGWGEIFWTFDTDTGDYDIPLQVRVGKVFNIGKQAVNIFVEPFYTPEDLHSGPGGDKWGVKLNVTLLFPDLKFGPLCGAVCDHLDMRDVID